jgi:hypothetical protein
MKTCLHLWQYVAELFLELEMFQTKVVEKIKTHILCSITFFRNSCCLWDNVEKYGTARQATDGIMIRRMHLACWVTKATDTHSEYVILIAFPRQQWLRERFSMWRLCVHCLSCYLLDHKSSFWTICVQKIKVEAIRKNARITTKFCYAGYRRCSL